MVARQVQIKPSPPTQISTFMVSGESAWFVNMDLSNTIYVGEDQTTLIIPLQPLGSMEITPGRDMWATTYPGNATVIALITTGQWIPSPAQVAIATANLAKDSSVQTLGGSANRSIAQDMLNANKGVTTELAALVASGSAAGNPGGIPLLRFTQSLGTNIASIVPANGGIVNLVNAVNINQPGFEFSGQIFMPAGSGTIPFVRLTITWIDSLSGLTTSFKHYYITCGNGAGNSIPFYLNGPCLGDQVNVFVTGLDPAVTASLQWMMNVTSHVFTHDQLGQIGYGGTAPNGFTNPGGDPAAGVIAISNPTITPSSTTSRLCAMHSGHAVLEVDNTSTTNPILVAIRDPSNIYGGAASARMTTFRMAAASSMSFETILPYGPVVIDISNQASTNNVTPNIALITTDQ